MDDISEDFVTELKGAKFQLSLEQFKSMKIKSEGKEEDGDLFLVDKVFPVVLEGLERLSIEVENYMRNSADIDREVRKRFNPCIFLAQFLMRNNPKYNEDKQDDPMYQQIAQYVKWEKFKRLFESKQAEILKFFLETTKLDKPECSYTQLQEFAQKLDEQSNQNKKLKEFFKNSKSLKQKSKVKIPFETVLQYIIKYCSQSQTVQLTDFDHILNK